MANRWMASGLGAVVLLCSVGAARADDKSSCEAGQGTFFIGTVTQGAQYQPERRNNGSIKGIKLSHTKLYMKPDGSDKTYEVNIANVFAQGYVENQEEVPSSLRVLKANTRIALCGHPYNNDGRLGVHWVHTNCGKQPTREKPNGWVRVVGADGKAGPNLEGGEGYCYLWQRNGRR